MSFTELNTRESDPAAEFLAREQNDITGLEDEMASNLSLAGSSQVNSISDSFFNYEDSFISLEPSEDSGLNLDSSVKNIIGTDVQFNYSNVSIQESTLLDFENEDSELAQEDNDNDNDKDNRKKYYVSIKSWFEENVERKLEESEKVKQWREENKKMLEEKDAKEAKEKEEMRLQAKKDLDQWYKNYEESFVVKQRDEGGTPDEEAAGDTEGDVDSEWKRIGDLCDLNNKSPHTSKDVSRLKEVLLSLKQNPPQKS